jgi:carboxypeptidase PM20D1
MIHAGDKENVLAANGAAVVNFRLLPGDSADDVLMHVRTAVNDPRVDVHFYRGSRGTAPSSVSPFDTADFMALGGAVRAVFPDVLVAPYLTIGATDARHYTGVATALYRFLPINQPGGTELLHAPNEHIYINVYGDTIRAFGAIIGALTK